MPSSTERTTPKYKSKISNTQNQKLKKQIEVDGIQTEFYKGFFETLKKDVQNTFNNVLFHLKTTPKTWNQIIITLISKQKEKLEFLKYWRYILLLCTDYKILTKMLANHLKQILPYIISQEQNCTLPEQTTFNNLSEEFE